MVIGTPFYWGLVKSTILRTPLSVLLTHFSAHRGSRVQRALALRSAKGAATPEFWGSSLEYLVLTYLASRASQPGLLLSKVAPSTRPEAQRLDLFVRPYEF